MPTIQNGIETVRGVKVELEDKILSTQSQSQIESTPVADRQQPVKESPDAGEEEREKSGVTGRISDDEVEEEEGGGEMAKQEDQSDVEEEELVSPVLDLDASFDKEVMELMTSSSPPPSFLHLSSPSPPPLSSGGKGRTLRPPPCSSRPSDDLSIRLRQSPFSTEASPETSPARTPVTPPPLSPPSPHFRSSPSARETVPLNKVNKKKKKTTHSLSLVFSPIMMDISLCQFYTQAPPTTMLPLTPKIGMGKPAISKRKFSPGRARVKQVCEPVSSGRLAKLVCGTV